MSAKTIYQPDFFDCAGKAQPEARGIVGKVIDRIKAMGKKKPEPKPEKKRKGQPSPVWKKFMDEAKARLVSKGAFIPNPVTVPKSLQASWPGPSLVLLDPVIMIAEEIVRHGDGEAFLKSVRRGRSTQRQNIRYQLLREVETEMGDAVPRRRPDANTPDSIALKKNVRLELEAYVEAGRSKE